MNDKYDLNKKEVPGYPNYQICESGRVFNTKTAKEVKMFKDKDGYLTCAFYKNFKQQIKKIHRILASVFIPNPGNLPIVDHIDRNKTNNSLENLRWVSSSMNSRNRSLSCVNTSSVKGVHIHKNQKYIYWKARIYNDNNKRISKDFPYTEEGFEQAKAWRRAKEIEFNYTQV